MTTKTPVGARCHLSIALLLVAIENSATVPRVLCKFVPLCRQTQPCFPGIFRLGRVRHLATLISVALEPVSIGMRHAAPPSLENEGAEGLVPWEGTLGPEQRNARSLQKGAGDYC
ncbi:hypothetical protein ABIB66_000999 [Bradyrhizobium sp. F1.13.3]